MSSRFVLNLSYNIAGSILPIVSGIVTVPFYLHMIGPARYGIISISWILLGYFGFLDFGLSRASANALGQLGHAPAAERAPVLMTALYLNLALGMAGGILMYFAGGVFFHYGFGPPGELGDEVFAAFPWMVPMLPLGMVMGVASGALESRERFLLSNTLQAGGTIMGQVLPLLCGLFFGPTLGVLIPALLLSRLLTVLMIYAVVFWLEWPIRPLGFHRAWARRLFGYGAWVSISSLIGPVLDTFDQVLIGRMLGPVAIAHYAVPMNIALRSQVLATALARTLFPRISREDVASGRRLAAHATVALVYLFGAGCASGIILSAPLLDFWVGPVFAAFARPVAEILMVGAWANGVAFMPYTQLQAQGRPDLTAKVHVVEVIPFLLGLWLLITWGGLPGAAMAWTLRVAADCIALIWLAGGLDGTLLRALPAMLLMAATCAVVQIVTLGLVAALALSATITVAFFGLGVLCEPSLREATQVGLAQLARISRRAIAH